MGNRAVITTGKDKDTVGIYLHWNGGPEKVLAFLDTAKKRGYRCPSDDESYGMARLTGIIHEFTGFDALSLGIGITKNLDCDNYDNGVYVVGPDWSVTKRWGKGHDNVKTFDDLSESQQNEYKAVMNRLQESMDKRES